MSAAAPVPSLVRAWGGIVPASRRGTLYGRDSAGVLWQQQAARSAYHPRTFDPRTRVGTGWNIYNTLLRPIRTPL
ncbi:N-acetylmuramoyl-L-alanine amidase [Actinacidiphila cocklensis]|uniref:N-acetylmuramoyl-L-alanine amidase n=1 Tax=Actinacidiphila cocklensis TaxID=887465 RepID=A0A9W4DKY4_9ACTN|nr:N-acetylmuramoyl-L-alanine amidase [Actinacidiphila cocklensis]